jgi:hypothetical protein
MDSYEFVRRLRSDADLIDTANYHEHEEWVLRFVQLVAAVLQGAGHESGMDIEVTESLLMEDVSENISKLKTVRKTPGSDAENRSVFHLSSLEPEIIGSATTG